MTDAARLIHIVAMLLSDTDDHGVPDSPEYDRACAEIITEYLGLSMESKDAVLHLLRTAR